MTTTAEVREWYRQTMERHHSGTHFEGCWMDHWACALEIVLSENERLRADDEVHWKTRRSHLIEIERLRALVTEARAMFEWLAVADSHLATDAWLANYIAKSAVDRPADAGSGEGNE